MCNGLVKHSNNNDSYDKIKHLVEVDDDILAVFIIMSSQVKDLYIAKSAHIDRAYITSISDALNFSDSDGTRETEKGRFDDQNPLGILKWVVLEYDNVRVLKIIEKGRIVVVLVNSDTQLRHTIDNILGYYYDEDETPKSLFND
jgi:hypothetical protein